MDAREVKLEMKKYGEVFMDKFEEYAETQPDNIYFYYGEENKSYSYAEFNRLANSFGRNLQSMGIAKGDRISLFLFHPVATSIAMFGIWKVGAVYCPLNYNIKGQLLSYHINDTKPRLLITEQAFIPTVNHIKDDIPAMPVILYQPVEGEHDYSEDAADAELDERFDVSKYRDMLQGDTSNLGVAVGAADMANIIYTSGTTGYPKGVVQPHGYLHNYLFPMVRFCHPDDVVYNDLPLYHVGGAFANVLRAAWAGSRAAVWDKFSPSDFWDRIRQSGANTAILLDVMIPWLMQMPESPDDLNNSLKMLHMQPLASNHHEVAKRFGIDVVTIGDGSTESGAPFFGVIDEWGAEYGTPPELYKGYTKDELREMSARFGIPVIPGGEEVPKGFMGRSLVLDVSVRNHQGEEAVSGEAGQAAFHAKVPNTIMNEYFNKPEATAEALKDGWFQTGDIVVRNEDGTYCFVDRIGGFIRSRGENMSSHTVEGLINNHPAINASAVFPIQAEVGSEEDIAAFVVLNEGAALTEDELRTWLRDEMPKYMWPRHIRFVDTLPVTPTFKVEKYKLKAMIDAELGLTR